MKFKSIKVLIVVWTAVSLTITGAGIVLFSTVSAIQTNNNVKKQALDQAERSAQKELQTRSLAQAGKVQVQMEQALDAARTLSQTFEGVKEVIPYTLEAELYEILKEGRFTIRFLGDDDRDKPFTGVDLNAWVHYLNRDHGWSTTKFKKLIAESI